MYTFWKLERTPVNVNTGLWDTTKTETLTSFYDPQVFVKAKEGKDSFNFKVTNFNGEYSNFFKPRDRIKLYRALNTTTVVEDDLLMDGSIVDTPEDVGFNTSIIRVKGFNFTEMMFGGLVFLDATNLPIDQALERALLSLTSGNTSNSNFNIGWSSENLDVRSDGSAFPDVGKRYYNKPFNLVIEENSSASKTGDGRYFWYLDTSNELHWRKEIDLAVDVFNQSEDNYNHIKIGKDTSGVKNYIIVKGGQDAKNNSIQNRYTDYSSISKHGTKFYFLVDEAQTAKNTIDADQDSKGVDNMEDASYPFTPTWNNGTAVTSFNNYNDDLRTYIKKVLKGKGKDFAELRKFGKLKVDLTMQPNRSWNIGDVLEVTIPSISSTSQNMRVQEVQYSTTTDTFSLEEDIGSL